MDRNFDTLDLPKRTEAAKGEWVEVEPRLRPVQVVKLCATKKVLKDLGDPIRKLRPTVVGFPGGLSAPGPLLRV